MIRSGKAAVAGIIGWPVAHSLSPRLHNYWLRQLGIDGVYVPLAVDPAHLPAALAGLPALGLRGVNVTVPHKETVLAALDRLDETAELLRAVNTILVAKDGTLEGRNTDGFGFMENLRLEQPNWQPREARPLILGAGGSARAVAFALVAAGVPALSLVNRDGERAAALASDLENTYPDLEIQSMTWDGIDQVLSHYSMVINSTTLGMTGAPALDLDLSRLPSGAIIADLVYTPLETNLLAAARARGLAAVDGLGMLIHQARPGFEAWFGATPDMSGEGVAALRGVLEKDLVAAWRNSNGVSGEEGPDQDGPSPP